MNGTYGIINIHGTELDGILDEWNLSDGGIRHVTDDVALTADPGRCYTASQSCDGDESVRCWLIGDIYGYDASAIGEPGGYRTRPANVDPAQYCASLYQRDGLRFVNGLNGTFTLLIYDREHDRLALCTDRFGTVPLYWTRPDEETIAFSTNIQFLPYHPDVDTAFNPVYLHEYLAFRRTFGVTTPLEGVEKLQPGTITTMSLVDGATQSDQYWRPEYCPRDESFEWFVDEFVRRFRTVVDEWTRDDCEYGVLLSGGRDSRLVLAALEDATAFHMNDWMNREARIAERVALEAGVDFEVLDRGAQYRIDALERNRWAGSFNGWFTQPYTSGFETEITNRVDGLLSGLYADSLFHDYSVPSSTVSVGPLGSVTVPIEQSIESVDEYINLLLESAHDDLPTSTDLQSILEANIYREGEQIIHHGVTYNSLNELVYYGDCYPLSNDDDLRFHTDLDRMLPYQSPFLDNRIIDLSLSMPVRYRLRRDLIGQAVDRLAPDLAAIPHATTGVALSRSFPIKYAGRHLLELWDKHIRNQTPPKPYLTNGPWLDDAELLRSEPFAGKVFERTANLADGLPGLDADGIDDRYRTHLRGYNRVGELYTLLTLLTMPVTKRILEPETDRTQKTDVTDSRFWSLEKGEFDDVC
ncbi:asparagine synthase [Haloterrigena sp. SYSU A121-1]|uniref:Asparagine synthase n=1 Tax=Haloterrigena gelatinilytica TaxID=2741724 RepID=A0A8J8KJT3_9EURY|nr:asparagine synthase-related protein [Haloterrigena gelatinilytica]NUB93749.1 asparagine synthase [Haloterrigena gelatinilytica]